MDDLTTERSFDKQATSVIDVRGFFLKLHMGVYTDYVADVQSNGGEIKCLIYTGT